MSRQNKVNPGMYTQRGRLTQDDAARELKRQRSIGSEHTWQPSKKDHFPRLASHDEDAALGAETSGDNENEEAIEATPVKAKQPARGKAKTARKTVGRAKNAGKASSAKAAKPAAKKRAAPKTVRKAVLARNVGGGAPKLRKSAARRKS